MPRSPSVRLSTAEFEQLSDRLRLASRAPRQHTQIVSAAALVRTGKVVSAGDFPAEPASGANSSAQPGVPSPYRLTQWTESAGDWTAVNDRLEIDIHGATSMTHLDTTEHFSWSRYPEPSTRTSLIDVASTGIVGRGILIDVPGVLGVPLEGRVVTLDDLQEVLERTGLEPHPGDALYISFGRRRRNRSDVALGSLPTSGLGIECADWLADIAPAAVVTDEGLDPVPSEVDGQPVPWHLLVLSALRTPLIDRAMLVPLADACREAGRWEFLSVLAPLPVPGASGSPINPLAIF